MQSQADILICRTINSRPPVIRTSSLYFTREESIILNKMISHARIKLYLTKDIKPTSPLINDFLTCFTMKKLEDREAVGVKLAVM